MPTYFQQIRGESTFDSGLLIAPQGIGAMPTMPMFTTALKTLTHHEVARGSTLSPA